MLKKFLWLIFSRSDKINHVCCTSCNSGCNSNSFIIWYSRIYLIVRLVFAWDNILINTVKTRDRVTFDKIEKFWYLIFDIFVSLWQKNSVGSSRTYLFAFDQIYRISRSIRLKCVRSGRSAGNIMSIRLKERRGMDFAELCAQYWHQPSSTRCRWHVSDGRTQLTID